jgi:hypothetical protein
MILRRVIAHFRKQEWTAIAIDFVIVVLGVFVGIQVANLNAALQDNVRAQDYLERILSDLRLDIDQIDKRIAYWGKVQAFGASAIDYAEGGVLRDGSEWATLIAFYQASQVWTYSSADATYRELTAAGDLALIRNSDLRGRLGLYYLAGAQRNAWLFGYIPVYREKIRGLTPAALQRRIWAACHTFDDIDDPQIVECAPQSGDEAAREVLEGYLADPQMLPDLRFWMTNLAITADLAGVDRRTAVDLAARIEKEIAP